MKVSIVRLLVILSVLFLSCENNELIIEPAGAAEYFINNQTTAALKVSFITSAELASIAVDSLPLIDSEAVVLIHTDGIIGVNPRPTDSFSSLRFVRDVDTSNTYDINSIDNSQWEILERDLGDDGYGLTKYQLVIDDQDFE